MKKYHDYYFRETEENEQDHYERRRFISPENWHHADSVYIFPELKNKISKFRKISGQFES